MAARKPLTRQQVLAWRAWSPGDIRIIEENLARLGIVRFEEVLSTSYVHCINGDGKTMMYINPGYIDYVKGTEPEDATYYSDGTGYVVLSTFQNRGEGQSAPLEGDASCPNHPGIKLPLSALCDECA